MGYKRLKIAAVIFAMVFGLAGCYTIDPSGFFVTDTNANQRFAESMVWNGTHPDRDITLTTDNYSVFNLSDCHLGSADNLDSLFQIAMDTGAVAVFAAGDLTTGHEEDFQNYAAHLPDPDTLPVFSVAGNHDLYFDSWAAYLENIGSSTYFISVTTPVAKDLYIFLDTGSGTLGTSQMSWLEGLLQTERLDYRHCIIVTHNNLLRIRHTLSTTPMLEEVHVLMDLCVEHDVNMVITGHDHVQYDELFGKTRHITLDALVDEGYMDLRIEGDSISYSFDHL